MTLLLSMKGVKRDWCHKIKNFDEFVMTLLASTTVFHKINLIFVIFDFLFLDTRHILDYCRSQVFPLDEKTNLFNYFIL